MGLAFFVVDDHEVIRKVLSEMLISMDHRVVGEAEDIEGAIASCSVADFDILVCDLGIPRRKGKKPIRLGGYEVAESVNKMKPWIGILFISATDSQTMAEILENSKVAGMKASFLPKPFTVESLANAIYSVLRKLFR